MLWQLCTTGKLAVLSGGFAGLQGCTRPGTLPGGKSQAPKAALAWAERTKRAEAGLGCQGPRHPGHWSQADGRRPEDTTSTELGLGQ